MREENKKKEEDDEKAILKKQIELLRREIMAELGLEGKSSSNDFIRVAIDTFKHNGHKVDNSEEEKRFFEFAHHVIQMLERGTSIEFGNDGLRKLRDIEANWAILILEERVKERFQQVAETETDDDGATDESSSKEKTLENEREEPLVEHLIKIRSESKRKSAENAVMYA